MGTNVSLTPELERFAQSCVESGRYNNVSEVMRASLRMLQEREQWKAAFNKSLEDAIAEGERDGLHPLEEVEAEAKIIIERARQRQR